MAVSLFPGQGSQFPGMGNELFEVFPDLVEQADDILGYSIVRLCAGDPDRPLDFTRYTQPALYVVNALTHLKRMRDGAVVPAFAAGHSLGEYDALFAAGAFDFATGLRLVKKRAELMGQATGGGMAAVLGKSEDEIRDILAHSGVAGIDIANLNAPSQTVISGLAADIERVQPAFDEAGARFVPLRVTGAFHSHYMAAAQTEFAEFIKSFTFSPLAFPVIANVTARPYPADAIGELLVAQITSSVRWCETIRYLRGKGETEFIQDGPGNVLTSLQRTIERTTEPLVVADEPAVAVQAPATTRSSHPANDSAAPAATLGAATFRAAYGLRYALVTGAMYKGVASTDLVARVAKAGMLGFFGTAGLSVKDVAAAIDRLEREVAGKGMYGMNLIHDPGQSELEGQLIDLYLARKIPVIEASAYVTMTPALVRYRASGPRRGPDGRIVEPHRIIGKVSRPEAAEAFLAPAPAKILAQLVADGAISQDEADLAAKVPVASDLSIEADSGGHSDHGVSYVLMPAMQRIRKDAIARYGYTSPIHIGAAGGIGTPTAAAAALVLGADFLVTGSINQCTPEAGTSDRVKDMLQAINVQDTAYTPAGDLFEYGAETQVLRRGLLFPARARKLYELYRTCGSLDDIDGKTAEQLQNRYFKRTFDQVFEECRTHCSASEIAEAERTPKKKMALVFRWYFAESTRLALTGDEDGQVDYQVQCGPALGAFNQWVRGTDLEDWRHRHVDEINLRLLNSTSEVLMQQLAAISADRAHAQV